MKRQITLNVKCSQDGCREYAHYECSSRREYSELYERKKNWLCNRHSSPNEVLSLENTDAKQVLFVAETQIGKFWQLEKDFGTSKMQSGFQYGNGYRAWAKDFPVGTKLIISAQIIKP